MHVLPEMFSLTRSLLSSENRIPSLKANLVGQRICRIGEHRNHADILGFLASGLASWEPSLTLHEKSKVSDREELVPV